MKINFKTLNGKIIEVEVEASDSIESVKKKLFNEEGIRVDDQRFVFSGKELSSGSLCDHRITNDSTIHLVLRLSTHCPAQIPPFEIVITFLGGDSVTLEVDENEYIKVLKEKIEKTKNIPVAKQKLLFRENSLDDNKTLSDYKIISRSIIEIFIQNFLTLNIIVKRPIDKTVNLEINSSDTIEQLKAKISVQLNIDINKQHLVYKNISLNDQKIIKNYSLESNSTIELYEKPIPTDNELSHVNSFKKYSKHTGSQYYDIAYQRIKEFGGVVKSPMVTLKIPPNAVNSATDFTIELSMHHLERPNVFDYPFGIHKITPVYEIRPHKLTFNESVTVIFSKNNFNFDQTVVCLFKQENDENHKILNKWSCYFPTKSDKNYLEFELNSFSFIFLAEMDMAIDVSCTEISNTDFNNRFLNYQLIKPGLNYRISCEDTNCRGSTNLIVINRGIGVFRPNEDVDTNDEQTRLLSCPICNRLVENIGSIKNAILFQAEGSIDFRLDTSIHTGARLKKTTFKAIEGNVVFFGDAGVTEKYSSIIINVTRLTSQNGTSGAAGVTSAVMNSLSSRSNVPNNFIIPPSGAFIKKN